MNLNGGSLTGGEFVTESIVGGVVVFAIYQSLLASEVLAMGDQALVQLAGEHRDEAHSRVVPEPVAGHADLAAAGLLQWLSSR